ncbi:hypothetical protein PR202_ga19159 [Eleusine coracana subsp. coracana]|uniref:WRKY domain-containing protein n=1 Tax=Eleusine coracana subsp. coracana TaxID=191504 RepID=A0AAV5CTH3_ELECO|nr:hypothetical protein PR202_ga19159 [Eleusine coracana subsp. coracana]
MCDYFLQRMEGDHQHASGGDLTDVVRAGGAMPGNAEPPSTASAEWQQLQADPSSLLFAPPPQSSSSDVFCGGGDPFSGFGDPFSSDYSSSDFLDAVPDAMAKVGFDAAVGGGGQMLDMSGRKPLLPRGGMQMPAAVGVLPSPLSPRAIRPYPPIMGGGDMVKLGITAGQMAGCAIDAAVVGMQMSSPRATGGIKRRWGQIRELKNQARKVVCIPAPTAAGGRPTGEVVPSDLWAWRKYGQKPIKGSPYPSSSSGSKSSQNEKHKQPNVKEESKDQATTTTTSTITATTAITSPVTAVKEEALAGPEALGRAMDTTGAVVDHNNIALMDHVFSESYKPMIPEAGQPDDFFSDLAELESDPMSLIFSKEYMEAKPPGDGGDHAKEKAISKDLDPFEMLDWSNTTSSAGSSFEQGKIG